MNERTFMIRVINKYGRDRDVFYSLFKKDGNAPRQNGLVFCPFHDNFRTPSAKLFKDDDAEKLWCFSENKMYSLADYYTKLQGYKLEDVFNYVWGKITDDEKEQYTNLFGDYSYEVKVDDIEKYTRFKNGEIDYKGLLQELIK